MKVPKTTKVFPIMTIISKSINHHPNSSNSMLVHLLDSLFLIFHQHPQKTEAIILLMLFYFSLVCRIEFKSNQTRKPWPNRTRKKICKVRTSLFNLKSVNFEQLSYFFDLANTRAEHCFPFPVFQPQPYFPPFTIQKQFSKNTIKTT